MKRLLLFSLFILSFNAYAKNKISMVTYFPVPYVAYSQINASQMDVGLTNTCHMRLGCEESQSPLVTPKVNVQSGRLDLNNGRGILGQSITLGSGTGTGRLAFGNVRMQNGNIQSVNATNTVVSNLKLFKHNFPPCKEKASSGQMSWKSLKLQGATSNELYLACGELGTAVPTEPEKDCSDYQYKLAHKSECCPGTPTTDSVCWKAASYEWGAKKNFSGTFTVTFGSTPSQSHCYEAANVGVSVYNTVFPKETQEWWILNCGKRNNSNTPSMNPSCYATNTPEGLVLPICYYTVDISGVMGHDYDIGVTNCRKPDPNTCECTASRWPGHECIEKPAEKNGW